MDQRSLAGYSSQVTKTKSQTQLSTHTINGHEIKDNLFTQGLSLLLVVVFVVICFFVCFLEHHLPSTLRAIWVAEIVYNQRE